ncbi:hypothetical protein HDU99_000371 [Rhizoclosmatium hyalinum]|nr:hypothetical protein HDU99_000371 [Rhizoclosmatium hyalinum]
MLAATVLALASLAAAEYQFPILQHMTNVEPMIQNAKVKPAGTYHMTYHNGPLLSNVVVHPLYYGNAQFQKQTDAFYASVVQSPWADVMYQYSIGRGSAVPGIAIPTLGKSTLDDQNDIQTMLYNLVQSGKLKPTANTYYPIHFAPGVSITTGQYASCSYFCAYHNAVDISALNVGVSQLFYGVMPDQGGACAGGCGNDAQLINNMFSVASHELAETMTDPSPITGWNDDGQSLGEIGDLCNAQQGKTVGSDGVTYVVQKLWSNSDGNCVVTTGSGPTTTKVVVKTTTTKVPVKTTTANSRCPHSVCVAGSVPLSSSCSACAKAVCDADSYCCTTAWDQTCVDEVASYCSSSC